MRISTGCMSLFLLSTLFLWAEPATICPGNPSVSEEGYHSPLWDALEKLGEQRRDVDRKKIADILEKGACPNDYAVFDGNYTTPIVVAVRREDIPLLELLLSKGADPNRKENSALITAIMFVDRPDILHLLIKKGLKFDPNLPNGGAENGSNSPSLPLLSAVNLEQIRMVEALLKLGANPLATGTVDFGTNVKTNKVLSITGNGF